MKKMLFSAIFSSAIILSACSAPEEPKANESLLSADDVLVAFQAAGLSAENPRDTTHAGCPELKCIDLITSEEVSIYIWPNEEKAVEYIERSTLPSTKRGNITIRMNWTHLDITPYSNVLNGL